MLEARRLGDSKWKSRVIDYVVNRQNVDGGYTFCQGTASSAQDTYYGLAILNLLNAKLPNLQTTINFLNNLNLDSIYSDYHVSKALLLCGEPLPAGLAQRIRARLSAKAYFGSTNVFSEVPSEFITTFMALELSQVIGAEVNRQELIGWLLKFKNRDGGFGAKAQSNINSTYYALASLHLLNYDLSFLGAEGFIRSCEKPHGGFTVVTINTTPYMEHTYYGTMALALLGKKLLFPKKTEDFVLSCQNYRGGFSRSDMGIATFEDTYYAVCILNKLIFSPG